MIYHITSKNNWEKAVKKKIYSSETIGSEGFIHCSPAEKLIETADKFFEKKNDLVILCIDEDKLTGNIVWEDLYRSGSEFPHIYGELNTDSVFKVYALERDADGKFFLPEELNC